MSAESSENKVTRFMNIYNTATGFGQSTRAGELPPGVLTAYDALTPDNKVAAVAMIRNPDDATPLR